MEMASGSRVPRREANDGRRALATGRFPPNSGILTVSMPSLAFFSTLPAGSPALALHTGSHSDPVAPLALALVLVLTAAKLGGELAVRMRQPAVLGELLALTVVAVAGKQTCSLGIWNRDIDRLSVGIGMIPRGEVGLIFANIGLGLVVEGQPVIDRSIFAAVVVMVILSTLMTPVLLKWSLGRRKTQMPAVSP